MFPAAGGQRAKQEAVTSCSPACTAVFFSRHSLLGEKTVRSTWEAVGPSPTSLCWAPLLPVELSSPTLSQGAPFQACAPHALILQFPSLLFQSHFLLGTEPGIQGSCHQSECGSQACPKHGSPNRRG